MKTKSVPLVLSGLLSMVLIANPFFSFNIESRILGKSEGYDPGSQQNNQHLANLEGQVLDARTGLPVRGAFITVDPFNLIATSGNDGKFRWIGIELEQPAKSITISIALQGYGYWILQNVKLISGDTLILKPELSDHPYLSVAPPQRSELPAGQNNALSEELSSAALTNISANVPLPEKIRVRVSGYPYHCDTSRDYAVKTIDFRQYAKNVLPNEWVNTWPADSLRAGAEAVKMYAWYMIAIGGKWSDADVWDSTCDQVYNPNFEYASTNAAVDYIWDWALSKNSNLTKTYYRAYYSQCQASNLEGKCMGQYESRDLSEDGYSWDQILYTFYHETTLVPVIPPAIKGYMLHFIGGATDYKENRLLIPLDEPATSDPGPPVDVGSGDFTIEWWFKAHTGENTAPSVVCGQNKNWSIGNILLDHSFSNLQRGFGVSIAGNHLVFGVSGEDGGDRTLCGKTTITEGIWHHVAIQRRSMDGYLWLFLDGKIEAQADGPDSDLSFPDDVQPGVESDPYVGFGAWKNSAEADSHMLFFGWMDEIRISNSLRYSGIFTKPFEPFIPDSETVGLFHLDEGNGDLIMDVSGASGGPSHGFRETGSVFTGGDPLHGTEWANSSLFIQVEPSWTFLPLIVD